MALMQKIVTWARIKSPWILHFNSGACNACDIEVIAALMPRYDVERFGVQLKGVPRHADVLVCSGPVTRQIRERLLRIYEQMAEPKFVVAVGTCACSGGGFKDCYSVMGGIDTVIPVSAYIPGCPASPNAIIDGVVKLLTSLEATEEAAVAAPVGSGAGVAAAATVDQGPSEEAEQ
jgi:NADH-quinone oxidoreductase B subunit